MPQSSAPGPRPGTRLLIVSFLLVALPLAAAAQSNRIESVRIAAETRDTVTLDVVYAYSGDRGNEAFLSARMAHNGKVSSHYGYRPGRVRPGRHRTRVHLGTNEGAPAVFSTNQLLLSMYTGGGGSFLERKYSFAKTWSRPGADLQPVHELVGEVAPAMGNLAIATATLQPAAGATGSSAGSGDTGSGMPVRRVLPNGHVELTWPDGTVVERYQGGQTVTMPDGTVRTMSYSSAQPPTPPSAPPDQAHARWLAGESERLLGIIRTLVGGHEPSVQHYLSREGAGATPYERIESRTRTVQYLVMP